MKYFSYIVTSLLLVLAGVYHSPLIALTSVLSLLLTLGREGYERYLESKVFKSEISPEFKARLQAIEQRTTAIEMGIQRRGF